MLNKYSGEITVKN